MPTIPQSAAGWRIEPPVSVPSAHGASPAATAAADPPEEPPGHARAIPGVAHRTKSAVLGGGAHRELVLVGLCEQGRAGRGEPRDDRRRVWRPVPLEDARAGLAGDARGAK